MDEKNDKEGSLSLLEGAANKWTRTATGGGGIGYERTRNRATKGERAKREDRREKKRKGDATKQGRELHYREEKIKKATQ